VTTAADLHALADRLRDGRARLSLAGLSGLSRGLSLAWLGTAVLSASRADDVRKRLKVIGALLRRVRR
jgi:hypothetical protein